MPTTRVPDTKHEQSDETPKSQLSQLSGYIDSLILDGHSDADLEENKKILLRIKEQLKINTFDSKNLTQQELDNFYDLIDRRLKEIARDASNYDFLRRELENIKLNTAYISLFKVPQKNTDALSMSEQYRMLGINVASAIQDIRYIIPRSDIASVTQLAIAAKDLVENKDSKKFHEAFKKVSKFVVNYQRKQLFKRIAGAACMLLGAAAYFLGIALVVLSAGASAPISVGAITGGTLLGFVGKKLYDESIENEGNTYKIKKFHEHVKRLDGTHKFFVKQSKDAKDKDSKPNTGSLKP